MKTLTHDNLHNEGDAEANCMILDDCTHAMKYIKDNSVNMILCDPPFGVTQNEKDIIIPFEILWREYNRIAKENAAILLFGQGTFAAKLILSNEKNFRYDLVWKTGNRVSGFLNAKKIPLRNHQQILVFYRKQPTYNPQFTIGQPLHSKGVSYLSKEGKNSNYGYYDTSKPETRKGETKKYPKTVLDYARPHPAKHPTEKPVDLLKNLILTFTNENDVVLDNTMGIGSTCIASKETNRKFIGIEKEKEYFDIAVQRLNGN